MSEGTSGDSRIHVLKTWPTYFQAILDGHKTFEFRKDDRGYKVGDFLHLREWDPESGRHTGRLLDVEVTYTLAMNAWVVCDESWVIMAIRKVQ